MSLTHINYGFPHSANAIVKECTFISLTFSQVQVSTSLVFNAAAIPQPYAKYKSAWLGKRAGFVWAHDIQQSGIFGEDIQPDTHQVPINGQTYF